MRLAVFEEDIVGIEIDGSFAHLTIVIGIESVRHIVLGGLV